MRQCIIVVTLIFILLTSAVGLAANINGFAQALFSAHDSRSSFAIQRAFIRLSGDHDQGRMGYQFIFNASAGINNTPFLHNGTAWLIIPRLAFIPSSKVTAGKFCPAFGRDLPTYPTDIYLINFFQLGQKTLINRDVGIIWCFDQPRWTLKLSATNGTEAKGNLGVDDNQAKDFYSRLIVKPIDSLEVGASIRHGKSTIERSDVWGIDALWTIGPTKLIGEFISSHRNERIVGWNALGIYQLSEKVQLTGWYEWIDNRSACLVSTTTGLGLNWIMSIRTRLAFNYLHHDDDIVVPDQFQVQLQELF